MPDMQTEIKKVLTEWTTPEINLEGKADARNAEAKSFCEKVYEHIKANPKCSLDSIRKAFKIDKTSESGLASSLKTLYDRKLIGRAPIPNPNYKGYGRRLVFVYWAVATTYTTQIKGLYSKKNKTVRIVGKKQKSEVKAPVTPPAAPRPHTSVEDLINSLNIYEARKVWEALNAVFGKQGK
jgi:hypothetical protein